MRSLLGKVFIFIILPFQVLAQNSFTAESLTQIVLEKKEGQSCPTGMLFTKSDWYNLEERIHQMKLSPSCIWDTIQQDTADHRGEVYGFAFGSLIGVGAIIAGTAGSELVIFKQDQKHLVVAQIRYKALSAEISFPFGVSRTQSVIFGHCEGGVNDYLGWFESYMAIAKSRNLGRKSVVPLQRELTGCESLTSTRGLNSSFIGTSVSSYELLGKPLIVSGPGAEEMLKYLEEFGPRR